MSFSPLETAIAELFDKLTPEKIAIHAHVSRDLALSVLRRVKQTIIRYHENFKSLFSMGIHDAGSQAVRFIDAAAHDIDAQGLADATKTTLDTIRRILACVVEQARLAARDGNANVPKDVPSASKSSPLPEPAHSPSVVQELKWPASIPEHSGMLKLVLTNLLQNSKKHDKNAVIVLRKELEALVQGAALLDAKVADVYTNLLSRLQPQEREAYALQGLHNGSVEEGKSSKVDRQREDDVKMDGSNQQH